MPNDLEHLLTLPFVAAATDKTLIPHVYDTCDQWCTYCPVTSRCLAYRCRPTGDTEPGGPAIYDHIAARMREALEAVRRLQVTSKKQSRALEMLLGSVGGSSPPALPRPDPLEEMGRRYAIATARYLGSSSRGRLAFPWREGGPTPVEVLAWFGPTIAAKIHRAVCSRFESRRDPSRARDAIVSARVAIIGIERSLQAIAELQASDVDSRLGVLAAHLRRLERDVSARFPESATVVRPGLDVPAPTAVLVN